jgi:N-acetylmuramoyl-L-alanine amidase
MIRICIDPGHGGYDSGAVGNGLREKDLTLAVSLRLRDLLTADSRFSVVMTRDGDYAPGHFENDTARELSERARISNAFGADLLVAIHFNAFNGAAHGVEALDYNGSGVGHTVAAALCDMIAAGEGLANRGVKATNKTFAVIRETNAPAIITESAFIDNAADIAHFDEAPELDKLARYHYRAICAGFGIEPQATQERKEANDYVMNAGDANKVIELLKAAYGIAVTDADRKEIGRLADEMRKASGQKPQNA